MNGPTPVAGIIPQFEASKNETIYKNMSSDWLFQWDTTGTANFMEGIEINYFHGLFYFSPIILGSKIFLAPGGRSYMWKCVLEMHHSVSLDRERT